MTIVSMSLCACVGGTQDSSSECSTETKKECCSSKKDSTQSHDHGVGEDHNHDQNEE